MKATVTIKMDNAAFEEPSIELARILHKLATQIEQAEPTALRLRDINGNHVGDFKITGKKARD